MGNIEDVQDIGRSSALYNSGITGPATKGIIVLIKAPYICEFGKKAWNDEELSHSNSRRVTNQAVMTSI